MTKADSLCESAFWLLRCVGRQCVTAANNSECISDWNC